MAEKKKKPDLAVKNSKKTTKRKQGGPGKPFKKGQSGNPAGRPKGSKNKTPQLLQQLFLDILFEFDEMDGLTNRDWAKQNRNEFMKMVARILPRAVDISGQIDHDVIYKWEE